MDRYYTQISVADWLLEKKITMLETLQQNRVGILKEIKSMNNREPHSYDFYWDSSNGILKFHSYVVNKSKGPKNVLLLSTLEPPSWNDKRRQG